MGLARSHVRDLLGRGEDWADGRTHRSPSDDAELLAELRQEIADLPSYGYRRVCALVNRQRTAWGVPRVNAKRVYRVMAQAALLLPKVDWDRPQRRYSGMKGPSENFERPSAIKTVLRISHSACCEEVAGRRLLRQHTSTYFTFLSYRDSAVHLPPEVNIQITAVQAVLEHLMGDRLCGIHLFGSAVDGGLKPCSDIDLMVTSTTPLHEPLRQRLMQALLAHSAWPGSNPCLRALEVTVVALSEIQPWRYPPKRELQFGEWLRTDIQAGRYEPAMPDNDLAILFTKLRRHSLALHGPAANVLFEAVPLADLQQSLADTISQWQQPSDWEGDERNILLALARIWFTAWTGEIAAKEAAAAWAAERLPAAHSALMARAAVGYLSGQADGLAAVPEQVANTIHFCRSEIEAVLRMQA
ncbi:nucleotidyltransferase domain protein [Delftia acidovorans]|nr:nucleotidyltransferase domain protein [Delftia acidovorans]